MKLLADASLPHLKTLVPTTHDLLLYDDEASLQQGLLQADALLCRSTLQVNQALLADSHIKAVATASSGSDHIDIAWLSEHGIACYDAKGCNAKAVGDYVLSVLAYLSRQDLIRGHNVAIIGYGHVGTALSPRLTARGFSCVHYDPPKAMHDSSFQTATLDEVLNADIICIHAALTHHTEHPSYHLFNDDLLDALKANCIIINAARGDIVDEQAMLRQRHKLIYCTDVYANEPHISPAIVDMACLCTPHIAGHSIEAKERAVQLALWQLLGKDKLQLMTHNDQETFDNHWIDECLRFYHPRQESQMLKNAHDLSNTFSELRRLHQFRHDFPFL